MTILTRTVLFTLPAPWTTVAWSRKIGSTEQKESYGVACSAKSKRRLGPMGFVEEDNSGKANIFAVEPKTLYTSSPRSDKAARQGLGGSQGLVVVLAIAAVVAASTVGLNVLSPKGINDVTPEYSSEFSLQELAERL